MRLGPYELEAELGRGTTGRVYRARHAPTGALRAVKTLDGSLDAETLARFRREAETLARAGGAGVVTVHEAGCEDRTFWFAMDLMTGSLRARMEEPLPWRDAVLLVTKLARSVGRCHALGLVHRDLKPENVLVDEHGEPRLADFGYVRDLAASRLTETGTVMGTLGYMAPEQLQGRPVDARADVYALGVLLYELVTGRRPFASRNPGERLAEALRCDHPPATALAAAPAALDALISSVLAPAPAKRPADGAALAVALEGLEKPGAGSARRPSRRLALVLPGLLVALGGLGLAVRAGVGTGPPAPPPPPAAPPPGPSRPPASPPPPASGAGTVVRLAGELVKVLDRHVTELETDRLDVPESPPELLPLVGKLWTEHRRDPKAYLSDVRPLEDYALREALRRRTPFIRPPSFEKSRRFLVEALESVPRTPRLKPLVAVLGMPPDATVCTDARHDRDALNVVMAVEVEAQDPVLAGVLLSDACTHHASAPATHSAQLARDVERLADAVRLLAGESRLVDEAMTVTARLRALQHLALVESFLGLNSAALEHGMELIVASANPNAPKSQGVRREWVAGLIALFRNDTTVTEVSDPLSVVLEAFGTDVDVEFACIRAIVAHRKGQPTKPDLDRARENSKLREPEARAAAEQFIELLEQSFGAR